jgi:hypothetical protein
MRLRQISPWHIRCFDEIKAVLISRRRFLSPIGLESRLKQRCSMPVFFKCKNCGQEHLSPFFFLDENAFSAAVFGVNTFSCPITFKTAAYEKKHMFWLKADAKKTDKQR